MKLDVKKFCSMLGQAEEKLREDEHVNQYLLDHVLRPALNGSDILIGDIDFSQFDPEDIEALAEYHDCLGDSVRDVARLAMQVHRISPFAGKTRTFC